MCFIFGLNISTLKLVNTGDVKIYVFYFRFKHIDVKAGPCWRCKDLCDTISLKS